MSPQLDSGAGVAEANANRIFPRSVKHTSLALKIQNKVAVAVVQKGANPGVASGKSELPWAIG